MNISKCVILTLGIMSLLSCKNDSHTTEHGSNESSHAAHVSTIDSTQPPMFNEIMAVHDEIMPWMNNIETLKQDIRMKMDSIDAFGGSDANRKQFRHAMAELNRADNAMTDWMSSFKENYDTIQTEKNKMAFLESERAKIEGVKNLMTESIKVAQLTLKNTPIK
ncbi:MAG TPA: hypothetical protein PLT28_10740 [Saprospiraceae bacterium]|nr:hypothetical protein [Saprospiraceae bacterium]